MDYTILTQPDVIATLSLVTVGTTQLVKPLVHTENRKKVLPMVSTLIYCIVGFALVMIPKEHLPLVMTLIGGGTVSGLYGASKDISGGKQERSINYPV